MRFEYVEVLWLLALLVPALTAFLWWAWRKKRWLIAQFVQSRLLANLTVGVSARRQKIRMTLLVAATVLLLVALARPQWGFDWEEARQRGLDIVVAIDTSKSMLAQDIAPNRLQRAKLAALDLKRLARTDRLGLVAFAGSAFLQCPLSLDDEAFRQSVEALDVNIIPQGGTALAEAIHTALSAFKEKNDNYKVLVLFTDGEDHDGRALDAAREAAKEGLKIFTIGVGTPNGELLPNTDGKGRTDFIKDESGNVVKSRLDEGLLRQIAQATGEYYMLLGGANTMDLLYERRLAPLPKTEHATQRIRRYHERFQWFLSLAIVLLLIEMFLPERKRVPRTEAMLTATTNAELRKAVTVALALALPALAWASSSEALKKYQAGRYDSALREYRRLLNEKPTDARLRFNAGAAAFQAKDYEKAQEYLESALLAQDLPLQQRTYYNLGNAQYRLGEEATKPEEKQQNWEQAVSSYESALKLDAKDADAKYNLQLVKKKLEELKQQQQQQQQKDKKDQKDDSKKDDQSKQDQKQKDQNQQDEQQKQQQENKSQQDQKPEDKKTDQDQAQKQEQQSQEQKPQPDSQQSQQGQQKESKGDKPEDESAQPASAGLARMTPQQAQQLLDGQKSEEKAMIFIPQMQMRSNRQDRVFKDW